MSGNSWSRRQKLSFLFEYMPSFPAAVRTGIIQSLRTQRRQALFLGTVAISFAVFFSIPVYSIEGNSFRLQWSIMGWTDVLILLFLSCLFGLMVVLQLENWKCCRACKASVAPVFGSGGAGVLSTFTAGLFATAACASCIVGLLGLIGISAAVSFKLLEYQNTIVWGAIVATVILVVWTARKVAHGSCNIPATLHRP